MARVLYPECGIIVFQGQSPRDSIISHKGYNPHALVLLDTYTVCMQLAWGIFSCIPMRFLEYIKLIQVGCFSVCVTCDLAL